MNARLAVMAIDKQLAHVGICGQTSDVFVRPLLPWPGSAGRLRLNSQPQLMVSPMLSQEQWKLSATTDSKQIKKRALKLKH